MHIKVFIACNDTYNGISLLKVFRKIFYQPYQIALWLRIYAKYRDYF